MPHSEGPARPCPSAWWCVLLGVLGLTGSLLVGAPSTASVAPPTRAVAAAAPDPSQDLPKIPRRCRGDYKYLSPEIRPCEINRFRSNRPTLVLWGDSHALQLLPALRKAVQGRKVNLVMFALGSCPPLAYDRRHRGEINCKGSNADAFRYVERLHRQGSDVRVVLGGWWWVYRWLHRGLFVTGELDKADYPDFVVQTARVFPNRAPALMKRLGRKGIPTDVIGHTATVPDDAAPCSRGEEPYRCDLPRRKALPNEGATRAWIKRQMRPLPKGARYVDPNRSFCNQKTCRGFKGGIHTFFNDLHVSATRASTMGGYFAGSVRRLRR